MSSLRSPAPMQFLESSDKSGTAPEDRGFRPDVAGLRAVAVLLVVLFHAGVPTLSGGYVGVDVFFVISGFVITGVLLRERSSSGRTSLIAFYGRRCRRIIPAASLVIIVTVAASYLFLGNLAGDRSSIDGRWAAVFLANFRFAATGTNYLASQAPPSPLQQFWSLAVEEQFYLVYPTLFVLAAAGRMLSLRARLAAGLTIVIVGSFALSVTQTTANPTVAYFSPFTRAWELALGALIAVGTHSLARVPVRVATAATWVGMGAILVAAFAFNAQTPYPGSLVAIPVVGAALVIAGGIAVPRWGAEAVLGLAPCQELGKLSYSLYLWHWPILIIAAESVGKNALPVRENLALLVLALFVTMVTYNLVENPIRHASFTSRTKWRGVGLGAGLVAATFALITVPLLLDGGAPTISPALNHIVPGSDAAVLKAVRSSTMIQRVPDDLVPPLKQVSTDLGVPPGPCNPTIHQLTIPKCMFGDPHGDHTMVLYGDSHAVTWFRALNDIATNAHWRLFIVGKPLCMANKYPVGSILVGPQGYVCNPWQKFAVKRIRQINPDLIIVTQESEPRLTLDWTPYTPEQWQQGLADRLRQIKERKTAIVVLGNIPWNDQSPPDCLARHSNEVQACSASPDSIVTKYNFAERSAAKSVGARYIDVTPWFCAKRCSPIIERYEVYLDQLHTSATYARFLEGVLAEKLQLSGIG